MRDRADVDGGRWEIDLVTHPKGWLDDAVCVCGAPEDDHFYSHNFIHLGPNWGFGGGRKGTGRCRQYVYAGKLTKVTAARKAALEDEFAEQSRPQRKKLPKAPVGPQAEIADLFCFEEEDSP